MLTTRKSTGTRCNRWHAHSFDPCFDQSDTSFSRSWSTGKRRAPFPSLDHCCPPIRFLPLKKLTNSENSRKLFLFLKEPQLRVSPKLEPLLLPCIFTKTCWGRYNCNTEHYDRSTPDWNGGRTEYSNITQYNTHHAKLWTIVVFPDGSWGVIQPTNSPSWIKKENTKLQSYIYIHEYITSNQKNQRANPNPRSFSLIAVKCTYSTCDELKQASLIRYTKNTKKKTYRLHIFPYVARILAVNNPSCVNTTTLLTNAHDIERFHQAIKVSHNL